MDSIYFFLEANQGNVKSASSFFDNAMAILFNAESVKLFATNLLSVLAKNGELSNPEYKNEGIEKLRDHIAEVVTACLRLYGCCSLIPNLSILLPEKNAPVNLDSMKVIGKLSNEPSEQSDFVLLTVCPGLLSGEEVVEHAWVITY